MDGRFPRRRQQSLLARRITFCARWEAARRRGFRPLTRIIERPAVRGDQNSMGSARSLEMEALTPLNRAEGRTGIYVSLERRSEMIWIRITATAAYTPTAMRRGSRWGTLHLHAFRKRPVDASNGPCHSILNRQHREQLAAYSTSISAGDGFNMTTQDPAKPDFLSYRSAPGSCAHCNFAMGSGSFRGIGPWSL